MKTPTNLILQVVVFLDLSAGVAGAQTAATFIANGRAYLTQKDLADANTNFAAAVAVAPDNEEANALYAATRLLVLVNDPADKAFLDRLGFASTNRSVYHWTAGLPKDTNHIYLMPTNVAVSGLTAFLRTNVLAEVSGASSNLAKIVSTNFLLNLSSNETSLASVTLDYGDVLMCRSGLHFAEYLVYTLNGWNLDAQLTDLRSLLVAKSLTPERVLSDYPALFTFATTNDLAAARAAFDQAVDEFKAASDFIESRPPGTVRLFNRDPSQGSRLHNFVLTLYDLQQSLNRPTVLTVETNYTVNFGTQFTGLNPWRSFFPQFTTSGFVLGTLPDSTFGDLITGLADTQVEEFLASKIQPIPNLQPGPDVQGQAVEVPFRVARGRGYVLQTSPDLRTWADRYAFVAIDDKMTITDAPAGNTARFYRLVDRTTNMPPPANDNYANRSTIPDLNAPVTGYNSSATREATDPAGGFGFSTAGHSVWWEWTATANETVAIVTAGSTFSPFVGVFTQTQPTGLASVQTAQVAAGQVNFNAVGGTTYEIMIDGYPWAKSTGGIKLAITAPPLVTLNNPAAQAEYTAPANVLFSADATDPDGSVAAVEFEANGTKLADLSQPPYSFVWTNAPPGYYGAFAQATDNMGAVATQYAQFVVHPANDDYANRITLSGTNVFAAGTDDGATAEQGEPNHGGQPAQSSVWYSWRTPSGDPYTIEVEPTSKNAWGSPAVSVYTVLTRGALQSVAEGNSGFGPTSVSFVASANTSYQIAVDGYFGGSFDLIIAPNSPPTVALTSPVDGASFPSGSGIVLSASASDMDGNLSRVEFQASDTNGFSVFTGTVSVPPFRTSWSNPPPGQFVLTATAIDSLGAATTSAPARITVGAPLALNDD